MHRRLNFEKCSSDISTGLVNMIKLDVHSLDDDCWGLILKKILYRHDIASVSLVCKKFLSITNQSKDTLRVSELTAHLVPKLIQRFKQLKSIEVVTRYDRDCNDIICQISQSKLEKFQTLEIPYSEILPMKGLRELGTHMKGLKKFTFSECSVCSDDDLILLTEWFPTLEELTVNGLDTITDRGLEVLASKLKRLQTITLSYLRKITDRSLISISSNCADLTAVLVHKCPCVTENGIGFLMRHSPKLTFLSLNLLGKTLSGSEYHHFTIENSIKYAINLEEVRFADMNCKYGIPGFSIPISDGVLSAIAKSCPRIKKIFFAPDFETESFSMKGVAMLLHGCSSLYDLTICTPRLGDKSMIQICKYMCNLTRLNVKYCSNLTIASFLALTKTCHFLESIELKVGPIEKSESFDTCFHRNYQVKELTLDSVCTDEVLIEFVSVCPNLERLCLGSCALQQIREKGISDCLDVCPELRYLDVSELRVSNFLGQNEEKKLKLKCILASRTLINDEALVMIGKRCPYLESLEIEGCRHVTNNGLKLMVSKCEKLGKINLNGCRNIGSVDVLALLVKLRPSLKEIITPLTFVPSDDQRNLFLRNGCRLISYNYYWYGEDEDEDES